MLIEITESFIESLATCEGGYTSHAFAILGVPWPPEHGWKQAIIGKLISVEPDEFHRATFTDKQWVEYVKQLDASGIPHNFRTSKRKKRRSNGKKDRSKRRSSQADAWREKFERNRAT